jgi:hypothetical protein
MGTAARWALCAVVLACVSAQAPGGDSPRLDTLRGKLMTLAEAMKLKAPALKFDTEPVTKQVVVLGDDGVITPLLSDETSRAVFVDERLRGVRAEIEGLRVSGIPYFQVIALKIERDGRFQTPEYYCIVCAISVPYPQNCPCCQGPLELRMKPDRR